MLNVKLFKCVLTEKKRNCISINTDYTLYNNYLTNDFLSRLKLMKKIGDGLSCSSKTDVEGELIYIENINDVLDIFDEAEEKICMVNDSGTKVLGPILSDLIGVLCTTVGATSHLATVSREFEIPCIMNLNVEKKELAKLNGKKAKISTDKDNKGTLFLIN